MHKKNLLSKVNCYLDRGLRGGILLRHAHRKNIPVQSFGNEIPISLEGHLAAIKWGQTLNSLPFEKIISSPVLRCMQTAVCCQTGFQKDTEIEPSPFLGNPGIFVADTSQAEQLFLTFTLPDILKGLVKGEPLQGMHRISVSINHFFNEMLFLIEKLNLLITHDSIMIPICCYLFESIDIQKYTPDFLEELLIFFDEDQIYCCFREEERILTRQKLHYALKL